MLLTTISEEAFLSKLSKQKLTRIFCEPDKTKLCITQAKVYAKAYAVPTTFGGGTNGHLSNIMPDATYFQKMGEHLVLGTNPQVIMTTPFPKMQPLPLRSIRRHILITTNKLMKFAY